MNVFVLAGPTCPEGAGDLQKLGKQKASFARNYVVAHIAVDCWDPVESKIVGSRSALFSSFEEFDGKAATDDGQPLVLALGLGRAFPADADRTDAERRSSTVAIPVIVEQMAARTAPGSESVACVDPLLSVAPIDSKRAKQVPAAAVITDPRERWSIGGLEPWEARNSLRKEREKCR